MIRKHIVRETNEAKKLKYQQIIEQINDWLVDSQLMQKCFNRIEKLKSTGMLYKVNDDELEPYLITRLDGDVLQNYTDQPVILCDDKSDKVSIIFGNGDEFIQLTQDGILNEVGEPLEPEEIGREKLHLLMSTKAQCNMLAQDFISWFDLISENKSSSKKLTFKQFKRMLFKEMTQDRLR